MNFDLIKASGYCRACMEDFKDMNDLFSTTFESWKLNEILFLITGITCAASDEFSHSICFGCEDQLLAAFRFRLKVHQTDQNLKLLDIPIKEEDIFVQPEIVEVFPNPLLPLSPANEPRKKGRKRADRKVPTEVNYKEPTQKRARGSRGSYRKRKKYQFFCNECGRDFCQKDLLVRHLKRCHFTQLRDYLCPHCAKLCTTEGELKIHTNQHHTGERNFSCTLCDRRFITQNSLKSHMITHSEERNFACNKCDAKFKTKGSLQIHKQNIHLDLHSHVCETCRKTYKTIHYLKSHMSHAHAVEFKYKCKDCNATFRDRKMLLAHRTEHTGEFYKCNECPKQYRLKSILKKHLLVNHSTQEKAYKCTLCSSEFHLRHRLNRHIRFVHKLDLNDQLGELSKSNQLNSLMD